MLSKTICKSKHQMMLLNIQSFLNERYILRYNVLLGAIECKDKTSEFQEFKTVDNRMFASIANAIYLEGIEAKDADIKRILNSDFVPSYDPIQDYLDNLPKWDGKDYVGELATRVNASNPHWKDFFHKWMLGMVATWKNLDSDHANSLVPVLVGSQGTFKSTFCRLILPMPFRYAFADRIILGNNAETERTMGRFLLINIDEFDQLNARRQAILKNILQSPQGKVRKLFTNNIINVRRYASFIATSNQLDLLTDPTGSRRFICTEVKSDINIDDTINYEQMYAQCVEELAAGVRYWLTSEEEKMLEKNNEQFKQETPVKTLMSKYYRKPEEGEEGEWITPLEMIQKMNRMTKNRIDIKKTVCLGRELHGMGYEHHRYARGIAYRVVQI